MTEKSDGEMQGLNEKSGLDKYLSRLDVGAIVAYGYTAASALKTARAEADRKHTVIGILGLFIAAAFVLVQLVPRISALEAMGRKISCCSRSGVCSVSCSTGERSKPAR